MGQKKKCKFNKSAQTPPVFCCSNNPTTRNSSKGKGGGGENGTMCSCKSAGSHRGGLTKIQRTFQGQAKHMKGLKAREKEKVDLSPQRKITERIGDVGMVGGVTGAFKQGGGG